ncbi:MAG: 1-acyl-sn-glycerol-3-phosphate acyltransferase [Sphingomicrobium sp.]
MVFLGATDELGIRPSFMGKHTLFRWPMMRFMRDMGGIAINRSLRANAVEQVVEAFARRDELALVVAAEGSRTTDGAWRSGFYHIATGAGVSIVPVWIDRGRRVGRIGGPMQPSGDYAADLHKLAQFFRACDPANPRFANIERGPSQPPGLPNAPAKPLGGRA